MAGHILSVVFTTVLYRSGWGLFLHVTTLWPTSGPTEMIGLRRLDSRPAHTPPLVFFLLFCTYTEAQLRPLRCVRDLFKCQQPFYYCYTVAQFIVDLEKKSKSKAKSLDERVGRDEEMTFRE